ncbi:MAG: metallophosphoesterase [Myxococcota bacterium]
MLLLGIGLAGPVCRPADDAPPTIVTATEAARPSVSLLAVGDTGQPWGLLPYLFEGQLAVGFALQAAHRAQPVDALVLLGDNFYPNGLREDELIPRVLDNVVRPYCAFVDPAPILAPHLEGACPPLEGPPPRLFVAVGNHDLKTEGSVERERDVVPTLVRNWELPAPSSPAIRELPGGLSLVFLDTEWPWGGTEVDELAAALSATRGPWRVIVGHRPPITGHPQLSKMVERAVVQSGRSVHAYLAGHVHGLVAVRGTGHAPALTVVAGSGSEVDLQSAPEYRIDPVDVVAARLGFARLDAFPADEPAGAPARLRLSLVATPPSAALASLGTTEIARYEVLLDGTVHRIDAARP